MSAVKYQLRELLPSLSAQARAISDSEVKSRFLVLKRIAESEKSVEAKCALEGKSTQWFYKWAEVLLKAKDLVSLKSKSRAPKRSPNKTPKRVVKKIRAIRKLEPFQGPERISRDLEEHYNTSCPPSTVYAVLKREGLITEEHKKKLTKRHLKRYRRPLPGYLQMDFKYVPYKIQGRQYYQLSAIDHHSSWRLIRAYEHKDEAAVMQFLAELKALCPFPIVQIQTDNDSAFTDKFTSQLNRSTGEHPMDLWCSQNSIEHKLIPVGEKELNGKVENSHKFDDREHFSQIRPMNFFALVAQTKHYNERWNERRKTKTLRWKTPNEVIFDAYALALAYFMILNQKYPSTQKPMLELLASGDMIINVNESISNPPPQKKPQRQSVVDRYLQYLDWEDKQRLKSLAPLLAMSQISSAPKADRIDSN